MGVLGTSKVPVAPEPEPIVFFEPGRDLLVRLGEARPVTMVLAHPGSGSSWACQAARRSGYRYVDHENLKHVKPDLCMSYKYGPRKPFRNVWSMLREPIRIVYSAAALCHRKPGLIASLTAYTIQDIELRQWAIAKEDPLAAMLASVVEFYGRAERTATEIFRVEDIEGPEMPEANRNTHNPEAASWPRLREIDVSLCARLDSISEGYGYEVVR